MMNTLLGSVASSFVQTSVVDPNAKRFWRFEMSTGFSNPFTTLHEIEFYSDTVTNETANATVTTTSALQPGFDILWAVDGNITTENPGSVVYDNDSVRRIIDFTFATAKTLHHFRRHDRADNASAYSISHTPAQISVYHSDDGVTWTLYFVGFDEATDPASWHSFDAPYVNGISTSNANLHCGLLLHTSGSGDRWHDMRNIAFFSAGVEQIGIGSPPVTSRQSSRHAGSATYDASNLFIAGTSRWVSMDAGGTAEQGVFFELATAAVIDRVDITATQYPTNNPKDFSLLVGDGKTFVPVFSVTGELTWGNGEVRSFT